MKIIEKKIEFRIDFMCKCGCNRFIEKKIYNTWVEVLCLSCEKIYILKIFTEEKE